VTPRQRALALILAAAVAACSKKPAEEVATTEAVAVEVEPAKHGTIRAVITASGTVEPAPGADWTILAPGPGRIAEMPKAEGDRVRAGDLLVRFDAPTLRSDAATKSADAGQAMANLEHARKNHDRLTLLLEKGIAARKEVEDARKELLDAESALRGASAAAGNAAELAARAVVRARFAGVVAKRSHNPGDTVDGAAGDPVLRVIDPSRLQVTVAIPVGDLARIVVGRAARVKTPGSEADAWEGKVLSLPAAVDPSTGTATVRVSAPAGLAAGTPLQVEIFAEERKDVVIVPTTAVVKEDEKAAVFVVGADDKAHRREVKLGIETVEETEIEKGVKPGEKVIVKGHEALPDGASVTTEHEKP
jgi:cobalt-zinc-cadmium efflux system membrane fusion protein